MRSLALALTLSLFVPAAAAAEVVHFRGEETQVPASWPVYRLAEHPRMCVRMDRRAVYLGTPSASQRCPAHAVGRRRAILLDPRVSTGRSRARAGRQHHPELHQLLHPADEEVDAVPLARAASAAEPFTGFGFDACTAPSSRAMSAWGSSPYRAIGVYIGGLNRGCSQPNLTSDWVREQIADGWHLIPTYVGLQAPTSSCSSCAKLSSSSATAQGTAAASDAVEQAQAVGIGPGNPIYFDMESYTRSTSASSATLTFLAAWTTVLHSAGYVSGIYSSSASGIADLAAKVGTAYAAPDDLWIANWNGARSTEDPYVPASAWSRHQRIHQYRGGHDESYGGVTINIDNNYVEGATVGSVSAAAVPKGRLDSASSPLPGQVRLTGWAYDPSLPTAPTAIRAYLGGHAGSPGSELYELGQVAVQPRSDVAATHRAAGPDHGFDVSFPVVASRRQRVCAYAVGAGSGAAKLLGCRTVGIAVPLRLSHLRSSRRGLHLRIGCEWPAGTACPGQILLRTKVAVRHRRGTRLVRVGVARRGFTLSGGASHGFLVTLNGRGRKLAQERGAMRAQLVIALPGGRVTHAVTLR